MTALTTWQTDDPCPICGAHLIDMSGAAGSRVIQQCRACAWSVTWAAPQLVLTPVQANCLAAMAADAVAYRSAAASGCPHCRQAAAGACPEHSPDRARIESYCQLVADLMLAGGER